MARTVFFLYVRLLSWDAKKYEDIYVQVLIAFNVASKNTSKEPGHSGYFSPVLRKMYIALTPERPWLRPCNQTS